MTTHSTRSQKMSDKTKIQKEREGRGRKAEEIPVLTKVETAIYYFFIHKFLHGEPMTFSQGQNILAEFINRHEKAVKRALKTLEERGWVTIEKKGRRKIIHFHPTEKELYRRLSFCSGINEFSLLELKREKELEEIVQDLKCEKEALEEELRNRQEREQQVEICLKQITEEQIEAFVDKLLMRIADNFDGRSFEEKVQGEIKEFKEKILQKNDNSKERGKERKHLIKSVKDFLYDYDKLKVTEETRRGGERQNLREREG